MSRSDNWLAERVAPACETRRVEFVIVAIVLAVALVGVVGFLVTAGRRRPEPPAPPASRSSSTSTDAAAPASTATLDRPETLSPMTWPSSRTSSRCHRWNVPSRPGAACSDCAPGSPAPSRRSAARCWSCSRATPSMTMRGRRSRTRCWPPTSVCSPVPSWLTGYVPAYAWRAAEHPPRPRRCCARSSSPSSDRVRPRPPRRTRGPPSRRARRRRQWNR